MPLLSFSLVDFRLKEQSANRYVNALSGNGVYEFFAAAYNNELDYDTFYYSLPDDKAFALLRARLPTPHAALASADPRDLTRIVRYPGPERRLNVVLVSVESFSADFMTRFGNTQGITPRLDALAAQGLLLTEPLRHGDANSPRARGARPRAAPDTRPVDREAPEQRPPVLARRTVQVERLRGPLPLRGIRLSSTT